MKKNNNISIDAFLNLGNGIIIRPDIGEKIKVEINNGEVFIGELFDVNNIDNSITIQSYTLAIETEIFLSDIANIYKL